ncbi:hypothetical protein CFN79_00865 [Chromobacterium vaccinii]|uniref:helix-turn-helix domain-containing protein n=1 Tax=Chromobacterium vaccinii TaxID=1108595 RepID=UPI000CE94C65|nr:helix-turn-helix domain-containing protein [Chromobacterium vaccinii]AVG14538.1 hypothetical protein CFN79_00865 [Chromobacterium vaccinii]
MENKNARSTKPETSASTEANLNDTGTQAQCTRLLAALKTGPVTTFHARLELNILHPAGRVKDLRNAGHSIVTQYITLLDENGRKHSRVAEYNLLSLSKEAT